MTDRYFIADDCTIWLQAMPYAQLMMILFERYFDYFEKNDDKIREDIILLVSTLVLSTSLLLIYSFQTWYLRQKIGYSHLILLIWTLIQVLPVVTLKYIQDIEPLKEGDSDEKQRFFAERSTLAEMIAQFLKYQCFSWYY